MIRQYFFYPKVQGEKLFPKGKEQHIAASSSKVDICQPYRLTPKTLQVLPPIARLPKHDVLIAADVGYSKSWAWRLGERAL